ncbi:MAG: hypothetical protein QW821_02385 [Candidatus Bathyarchaeia archaeon]
MESIDNNNDYGDAEKTKKLVEFRTRIEKRINELSSDLEGLRILLEFIDNMLLEKGFMRPEIKKQAVSTPSPKELEYKAVAPIKTVTGELLANLYIGEDFLRVVLAEDKKFDVNTPPFMQFLVERVLAKMQEKDREASRKGEIPPDKIFSYSIIRDGDILQEVVIKNIVPERFQELKSSIRWTLEKMYEKMKASSANL